MTVGSNIARNQEIIHEVNRALHEKTHDLIRKSQTWNHDELHFETPSYHLIETRVRQRFAESMCNTPIDQKPTIEQRLDAVYLFYGESTKNFVPRPPHRMCPSPSQFLNLLKCIWLLEDVKHDRYYDYFCNASLNEAWAIYLERKVEREARRFFERDNPLWRISEQCLLQQLDSEFDVCPWRTPTSLPNLMELKRGESLLMRADLQADYKQCDESMCLFRQSPTQLRLVQKGSGLSSAQKIEPAVNSMYIDTLKACLDPYYATNFDGPPTTTICWKPNHSVQFHEKLRFTNMKDVYLFQAHMTGFNVRFDSPGFKGGRIKAGSLDGQGKSIGRRGRVQIWVHRKASEDVQNDTKSIFVDDSGFSAGSNGSTSKALSNDGLAMRERFTSLTIVEDGVLLDGPTPSQIIIFSEDDGLRRMTSIPIDQHTQLAPDKCNCSKKDNQCQEVVIRRSKKAEKTHKKFIIRTFQARTKNEEWNIALFGKATHERSHQLQKEEVNYVSILFDSVQTKNNFVARMRTTCDLFNFSANVHNQEYKMVRRSTGF